MTAYKILFKSDGNLSTKWREYLLKLTSDGVFKVIFDAISLWFLALTNKEFNELMALSFKKKNSLYSCLFIYVNNVSQNFLLYGQNIWVSEVLIDPCELDRPS